MSEATDNRSEDTEICPHCQGSGRVNTRAALDFPVGTKAWWKGGGYGYEKRIPCVVVAHSKSGKTARVSFTAKDYFGNRTYEHVANVAPKSLEIRNE